MYEVQFYPTKGYHEGVNLFGDYFSYYYRITLLFSAAIFFFSKWECMRSISVVGRNNVMSRSHLKIPWVVIKFIWRSLQLVFQYRSAIQSSGIFFSNRECKRFIFVGGRANTMPRSHLKIPWVVVIVRSFLSNSNVFLFRNRGSIKSGLIEGQANRVARTRTLGGYLSFCRTNPLLFQLNGFFFWCNENERFSLTEGEGNRVAWRDLANSLALLHQTFLSITFSSFGTSNAWSIFSVLCGVMVLNGRVNSCLLKDDDEWKGYFSLWLLRWFIQMVWIYFW